MADMNTVINGLIDIGGFIAGRVRFEQAKNFLRTIDDTIELLKEQEDLGTELTNAVELIHKKNERIEKLLKEQEKLKFFVDENGKITPLPVVVRCKDCRWGDRSRNGKGEEMILCYNGDTGIEDGYLHEPDWFCAEGERKDS